jgi:uncharacterized protein YutE (UPF0331/DUF86 family)
METVVTDTALVLQKLTTLRDHADRVRRRYPATIETLRHDIDLQDAIALSILVAVQEATDIAFHIVADEGWGVPASYADGFDILARRSVIDAVLAAEMGAAVGLRNRIAHGYASIDVDRLWNEIPRGLAALERYASAVARFVPPRSA